MTANVSAKGDLIRGGYEQGVIRGDAGDLPMNTSVNKPAVGSYPCDYSGDATNAMGKVGGTESDSMFEKMNRHDDHLMSGNTVDSMGADKMSGTGSDAPGEEMADEQMIGGGDTNPTDTAEDRDEKY